MRPTAAPASSGAVPWVPTTGTPPPRWPPASPPRSSTAPQPWGRSLSRPLRPSRAAQHSECSSGHGPRFLANLWRMALRAEGEDALCLVELRGFEPLTPCMPSRDPHHSAHHEASRSRPSQQSRKVAEWWFTWLRRAELLRACCANALSCHLRKAYVGALRLEGRAQ